LFLEKINKWKLFITPTDKDSCRFIVKCENRETAYRIYQLIRGYYIINEDIYVHGPSNKAISIYEYTKHPRLTWTKSDWVNFLNRNVHIIDIDDWRYFNGELSVTDVVPVDNDIKIYIDNTIEDESIINSLNCLNESIILFDGYIENAYPAPKYRKVIPVFSADIIERAYYENRAKYELAFIAAFKGIEHILGVNDLKKNEITNVLEKSQITTANNIYSRKYENSIGFEVNENWNKVLSHFIDIRNTVAAHGNKKPPIEKIINFYSIYEIQKMLIDLILLKIKSYY